MSASSVVLSHHSHAGALYTARALRPTIGTRYEYHEVDAVVGHGKLRSQLQSPLSLKQINKFTVLTSRATLLSHLMYVILFLQYVFPVQVHLNVKVNRKISMDLE